MTANGDGSFAVTGSSLTEAALVEFNPYHGKDGRFTSKRGPALANVSPGEALDTLAAGGQASVAPDDVAEVMDLAAGRSDHPDITELHVSGTSSFGDDGLGIDRKDMPQLDARAPEYFRDLEGRGISVQTKMVSPQSLQPTQHNVSATNTAKLVMGYRDGSLMTKVQTDPSWRSIVSKDGYVLDGHHRWAAGVAYSFEKPGFKVPVNVVDLPMKELLSDAAAFTAKAGIANKALGEARIEEFNPNHDEMGRFAPKMVTRAMGGGFVDGDGTRFTEGEVAAVRDWQGSFSDVDYIQSDPTSLLAQDFMSAVEKSPVVRGKVYRGIRESAPETKVELDAQQAMGRWQDRVGKPIKMNEPVSTSPSYNTAGRFGRTVFEIDHGGTAHDIRPLSRFPDFPEAVMKPGTFRVTGVRLGRPTDYRGGRFTPFHLGDSQSPNLVVSVTRTGD
jgi:hypothetical protein